MNADSKTSRRAWHWKRGRDLKFDWQAFTCTDLSSDFLFRISQVDESQNGTLFWLWSKWISKMDLDEFPMRTHVYTITHTCIHTHTHVHTPAESHSYWMLQYIWCSTFSDWRGWRRANESRRFRLKGSRTFSLHNVTTAQQSRLYRSDAIGRWIDSIYPEPDEMAGRRMGGDGGEGKSIPPSAASAGIRDGLSPICRPPTQSPIWEGVFDLD